MRLLLFLAILVPRIVFSNSITIDERKTDIYFANGIKTSPSAAWRSTFKVIQPAVRDSLFNKSTAKMKETVGHFDYAYNDTYGAIPDLLESAVQIASAHTFDLTGYIAAVSSIPSALVALVHNANLRDQVEKYKKSINSGHAVIVVAHSQGNLFTNEAFSRLKGWMQPYFHRLSIASPDNFMYGGRRHISFDNDVVGLLGRHSNIKNPVRHLYWKHSPAYPYSKDAETYEYSPVPPRQQSQTHTIYDVQLDTSFGFHLFDFYMGKPLKKPGPNGSLITDPAGKQLETNATKDLIIEDIQYFINAHKQTDSQWQKSADIGCSSSCGHRIIVKHRYDSALDANMSGVPVLPFDAAAKLYPVNGKYVKADPAGVRVDSPAGGGVCHRLFDDSNSTVDTIADGISVPTITSGAVEVTVSWSAAGNDFDLNFAMPGSVKDVQACRLEHAYVKSEYDIYPGTYSVSVAYAGGGYHDDTVYIAVKTPDEFKVFSVDTNASGFNPGHIADIVVKYVDNKPVTVLTPLSGATLVFSTPVVQHGGGGYWGGGGGGGGSRYSPPSPPVCSPAMSCGCMPCEYLIIPYISQVLKGPVSGADIALYTLDGYRSGLPLYQGKTSTGNTLYDAGRIAVPRETLEALEDQKLYLFEVSGGVDIDPDDDMSVDAVPLPNRGTLHALVTGAELKTLKPKVNLLSEVGYQMLKEAVASGEPEAAILSALDDVAARLLSAKIYPQSGGGVNHTDLLEWLPTVDRAILFADYDTKAAPVARKLLAGDDIYDDAYDLVYYPEGTLPLLKSAALHTAETTPVGTVIGRVELRSSGKSPVHGMRLSGEGADGFGIDAEGRVTLLHALDYERKSYYNLYAYAENDQGEGKPVLVTVAVDDVADAPAAAGFEPRYVFSASAAGTPAGRIVFAPNAAPITSVRIAGQDAEYFSVNTEGNITVAKRLENYLVKKAYTFDVTASNTYGDSRPAQIVINVSDGKETPLLEPFEGNVTENSPGGTCAGRIGVLREGSTPLLAFETDETGPFEVKADGSVCVKAGASIDFEKQPAYFFAVRARNDAGAGESASVTIRVNNLPDTPPRAGPSAMQVAENVPEGTVVGTLSFLPGEAAVDSIALSGEGAERFRADTDGTVRVAPGARLDYESRSRYGLTFHLANAIGTGNEASLLIDLDNVPEKAPVLADLNASGMSSRAGTIVGHILKSGGDTPVEEMSLLPESPFDIDLDGDISLRKSLEGNRTHYELQAVARNGYGDSNRAYITIEIDPKPQLDPVNLFSPSEAVPVGTRIGTVGSLSSGLDPALLFTLDGTEMFTVDGNGSVYTAAPLDFEQQKTYSFTVSASNRFGSSGPAAVRVAVQNVIESVPLIRRASSCHLSEKAEAGTVVLCIEPVSPGEDSGIIDRMELVSGDINGTFRLNDNGTLTLLRPLDYEQKTDYHFDVRAYNEAGGSDVLHAQVDVDDYSLPFITAKKRLPEKYSNAYLGYSLALDAGLFIIGAPDTVGEEEYGGQLAQVFSIGRDGMISKLEDLLPQDAPLHNFFGYAVDISGSSIIVGAYEDNVTGVGGGAVYLYGVEENGSISGKRKFHAAHTKNGDHFGSSVTIDGLYIAAGAPRASTDAAADSGAVHVFGFDKQGAVVELAELYDDNATEYEEFGHAIDLHNGLLAIGVPYANYKSKEGCGKVQLYRLSPEGKAVYLDTLYNPNPVAWDEFGSAVSVSGAHVCVSAGSGVFIYTLNAAGKADLIAKIPTPQEAGYFGFGAAVINGDRIVVYARERKGQHTASYRYIYQLFPLSSGIEVGEIGKLEAAGSWQNSAVDGDRVLIGAPELKASGASSPSGGFYLLDIEADTKIYVYSETHQQTDINRSYTGPIYAIDAASPAGELSYAIDAFADGGFFALDGRDILLPNALDYLPPIDSDADGVYQLSVTMEDPAGNSADVYVDVNVSR